MQCHAFVPDTIGATNARQQPLIRIIMKHKKIKKRNRNLESDDCNFKCFVVPTTTIEVRNTRDCWRCSTINKALLNTFLLLHHFSV